jgi:hypothetical protein
MHPYSGANAAEGTTNSDGATIVPPRRRGTPQSDSVRSSLQMKLPTADTGADATSAWIPSTPESSSPRPIGVDPAETGSFQRLNVGEGATITTRENAEAGRTAAMTALKVDHRRIDETSRPKVSSRQTEVKHDRRIYVALAIFAVVLVAAGFVLVRQIFFSGQLEGSAAEAPLTQADIGQTISYAGASYALMEQGDGSFALTYQPEGSTAPQVLCTLVGHPTQLFLYNGTFVIPENLGESWDVVAFMRGISTEATAVTDADGAAITGEGSVVAASLDGSMLHVTTDAGTVVDVSLE